MTPSPPLSVQQDHRVLLPGLTDTQSGCTLQTKQPEPIPKNASSPKVSNTIQEVPRDEPQQRAHTATLPEPGVRPNPSREKIDEERWEEIIRSLQKLLEERKNICTEEEKAKAWTDVADTVKTYSDDMIERWNKQIDVYLVFAGLFSAILTAFNVQSYPLLQQTTPDTTAVTLQQISLQLQSFAISLPFVNSTHPAIAAAAIPPSTPFPSVPRYAIWLNVLWFSSLILSLTSSVIGILVKQWLGEYSSGLTGNSREAARLRQYRLNNLVKWHVGDVIVLIPVLLLISLALFLAGLLILLWNLHPTVAIVASGLVGVLAVSTVCVTLLPVVKPSCAYLSPQTLVLISLFWHTIFPAAKVGLKMVSVLLILLPSLMLDGCIQLCLQYLLPRRERWGHLARFHDNISHFRVVGAVESTLSSLASAIPSESIPTSLTWQGHERSVVNRLKHTLDIDILIKAYDSSLDASAVSSAAVCLPEQPSGAVVDYSVRLHSCAQEHFGDNQGSYPRNNFLAGQTLLCTADVMGPFVLPKETVFDIFHTVDVSNTLSVVPSTGLSVQTPAQKAWLRLMASSDTMRTLHSKYTRCDSPFLRHCRQTSQEPADEKVQEFFEDTRRSPSRDIDILRRETDRCLRLATTSHVVQGALVDHSADQYFKVYLHYLRSVDEYLWYAARVLKSTATDAPGFEDPDVIRENTRDILRTFERVLHRELNSTTSRCRRSTFKHAYRAHLRFQCNILNTLNSQHELFRSIGSFDRALRSDIYRELSSLTSWMKQQKIRAGRRDSTEASPSLEDLCTALLRYVELYLS
ncbi:hypothetical protein VTO73DRAFT_15361 [Trametes versicolor]